MKIIAHLRTVVNQSESSTRQPRSIITFILYESSATCSKTQDQMATGQKTGPITL